MPSFCSYYLCAERELKYGFLGPKPRMLPPRQNDPEYLRDLAGINRSHDNETTSQSYFSGMRSQSRMSTGLTPCTLCSPNHLSSFQFSRHFGSPRLRLYTFFKSPMDSHLSVVHLMSLVSSRNLPLHFTMSHCKQMDTF